MDNSLFADEDWLLFWFVCVIEGTGINNATATPTTNEIIAAHAAAPSSIPLGFSITIKVPGKKSSCFNSYAFFGVTSFANEISA